MSRGTGYGCGSDPEIPERAPFFWRAAFSCSGSSPPLASAERDRRALDLRLQINGPEQQHLYKHTPLPTNQSIYHSARLQTGIPEQTTTLLYSTLCTVLLGPLSNIPQFTFPTPYELSLASVPAVFLLLLLRCSDCPQCISNRPSLAVKESSPSRINC